MSKEQLLEKISKIIDNNPDLYITGMNIGNGFEEESPLILGRTFFTGIRIEIYLSGMKEI